jgi:hypothetical protein
MEASGVFFSGDICSDGCHKMLHMTKDGKDVVACFLSGEAVFLNEERRGARRAGKCLVFPSK